MENDHAVGSENPAEPVHGAEPGKEGESSNIALEAAEREDAEEEEEEEEIPKKVSRSK